MIRVGLERELFPQSIHIRCSHRSNTHADKMSVALLSPRHTATRDPSEKKEGPADNTGTALNANSRVAAEAFNRKLL